MNNDFFTKFELGKLFFYTNTQPFWIDIYLELSSLQMFWNLYGEKGVIGIIKLEQTKFILALITLSYLSIFSIHNNLFLRFILIRISILIFLLFLFRHLHIHFFPHLLSIWCFELRFLLLGHILLHFSSLLLIVLLLSFLQLTFLYSLEELFLQFRQHLLSFDLLGRSNNLSVITFKSFDVSNHIIFASIPIFARISREIDFFEAGQLRQTLNTIMQIQDIYKIDSHIQLFETLASLNVLYFADIIQGQIEILKFFELVQILHLLNDVILQIEYLKMPAEDIQILDLDQLLLMQ